VRVATFNINNINKRLDNLLAWLAKAEPDLAAPPCAWITASTKASPIVVFNNCKTLSSSSIASPTEDGHSRDSGLAVIELTRR
jgi:hypothetical protein